MTDTKKIQKIESVEKAKFFELFEGLLKKMGYSNIRIEKPVLFAETIGPMVSDRHFFMYFDDSLTGNVDKRLIADRLLKAKGDASSIFVLSKSNISNGFKVGLSSMISPAPTFIGREELIDYIDEYLPEFWKHDDVNLLDYEKYYKESILQDSELKSLKIFSEKYQKLLDIFIEPKIIHFDEDPETKTPISRKITLDKIVDSKKPLIVAGDAGMGKTTLLKRVGELIIKENSDQENKSLPIFITVTELHESGFDITAILEKKILVHFEEQSITELLEDYNITILIDSIDELEISHQEKVVKQLNTLHSNFDVRFILGTRNQEKGVTLKGLGSYDTYDIARFNNQQIEQFVKRFFLNQQQRAESLLDALRENRVIEKLPITPLTLSLISILYEENDLEIPATITDIYDNFNSLLIGKPLVSSKIELIDVSFRERILSLYGLELLKRKEHTPMSKKEFFEHFRAYYSNKTIPIKTGTLEDFLEYIINNTGILYIKDEEYVSFSHDSFMEYYASLEIFKHQRALEKEYVNNFFDINWQNSAIFYAGHSKDMSPFLEEINDKICTANNLNEYFASIGGAGFLLQALFQTDNQVRKVTVDNTLEVNVRSLELLMKLSSDDQFVFKSFRLPIIWMLNVLTFYENFNSGTLGEPLKLSFNDMIRRFRENGDETTGFKSLTLAMTLNSKRINEGYALEELVFDSPLLDNNILTIISDIGIEFMPKGVSKELKAEVKKQFDKSKPLLKKVIDSHTSKLRFSGFDVIHAKRKVKIVTEGDSDAKLIEHAYMVLKNGDVPYWSIKPAGNGTGGAHEVSKALMSVNGTISEDEIIIGVFDHDAKGVQEFNGLKSGVFESIVNNTIKKHKDSNIYAILLPIPDDKEQYLIKEQEFNYFEIEHYLPMDELSKLDALRDTPLTKTKGIYSVKDSKKNAIIREFTSKSEKQVFKDFALLLQEIDKISGIETHYE